MKKKYKSILDLLKSIFIFFIPLLLGVDSAFGQFSGICYQDNDGDGFGNPNVVGPQGLLGCNVGFVTNNFDCDDTKKDINPNTVWYKDLDNDGYTDYVTITQCNRPNGYKLKSDVLETSDCNDNDHTVNKAKWWFADFDNDGFCPDLSIAKQINSCSRPFGYKLSSEIAFSPDFLDCNDNDSLQKPNQQWYPDVDGDGFPGSITPTIQCLKPSGFVLAKELKQITLDCNDTNPAVFPGLWYEDKDGDGLITGNFVYACNKPPDYIFLPGGGGLIDCDDTDARATIVQGWYADLDGDRHGGNRITACKPPVGYFTQFELLSINDCNDNDNKIYPNAPELCDGKDNNCNGIIDELACCPTGPFIFVNANATGANNGSSWANAYTKLQDALELARRCPSVTSVWVAKGVYYPDEGYGITDNNRTATFTGRNNLLVIGGFDGNEFLLSQRKMENIPATILNGDILKNGDFRASYNVVRLDGLDSTFRLDGFTIINGNASSPADPLAYQRSGAGMVVLNGNPTISNCYFRGNAAIRGAAIANLGGAAFFTNCVITGNNQANTTVGAVYNSNASPTFLHCTIATNNVGSDIFYNDVNVSAKVYNCIIRGATPAISGPGSTLAITSIIQSATVWPGIVNSNADPLFVNEAGRNFSLMPCSPAIDIANAFTFNPFTDIAGAPRTINGLPDIGAFERRSVQVLYVNAAATGNGDGSSWLNAMSSLQQAMASNCAKVTQLWVARGTYKPAVGTNRDSAFVMRNNLAIYGGFAGTETLLSQRNWRLNPTILSGDVGVQNNIADNSFNIIRNNNNGLNATAILDGFTITGGNANGGTYLANRGGGINNYLSSPAIANCQFLGNNAVEYGGAMFNQGSTATVINSVFMGNTALYGGGLYNESAATELINCTMSGNAVAVTGAAMYTFGTVSPEVTNSIIWGNGSGIQNAGGATPIVTNSIVQGGYAGTGNLNADPAFMQQPAIGLGQLGDLRLLFCSPARNAGNNAALPIGTSLDLAGFNRIFSTTVDMGAYEAQNSGGLIIYVDANASGNNDGTSWANAFTNLEAALNDMNLCNLGTALTLQIAAGTYTFPVGKNVRIDNLNATILGGYPTGGGTRNPSANNVIIKGEVRVLKNVSMNGVRVDKQ